MEKLTWKQVEPDGFMINQRESKTLKTKRAIMEQYKEVFSWNKVVVPLYNRMKK